MIITGNEKFSISMTNLYSSCLSGVSPFLLRSLGYNILMKYEGAILQYKWFKVGFVVRYKFEKPVDFLDDDEEEEEINK